MNVIRNFEGIRMETGKYLVKYYYIRPIDKKKIVTTAKYFIFPKAYHSIIDQATKEKLEGAVAILCATSMRANQNKVKIPAMLESIEPATEEDLAKYKDLDLAAIITPNKDQARAIDNFKKIKAAE